MNCADMALLINEGMSSLRPGSPDIDYLSFATTPQYTEICPYGLPYYSCSRGALYPERDDQSDISASAPAPNSCA